MAFGYGENDNTQGVEKMQGRYKVDRCSNIFNLYK